MDKLKTFLSNNRRPKIVVLTGAGISAESGIKTFRETGGLWENYKIEDVATPEGFYANPELVYAFYNERRKQAKACEPNRGHHALVELESMFDGDFTLITQNVDDLHEKAGTKNLIHMHGELFKTRCVECSAVYTWHDDLFAEHKCINCKGQMRPHIVWFNEMPIAMDDILLTLNQCDLFISIGTSGSVYPAAGFYQMAAAKGAHTIELNIQKTGHAFDTVIEATAVEAVDKLLSLIRSVYVN